MDNMKDKMEDKDSMRKRFDMLRAKDENGTLDSDGRMELARLRERMGL
jgi:hypothetical protein